MNKSVGFCALLLILVLNVVSVSMGETVVDVSQEWKAHASTSSPSSANNAGGTSPLPPPPDSPACECDTLTTSEKLDQSTYAFTGKVLEAKTAKKGRRVIMFDVDEIFKGSLKQELEVIEETRTNCDFSFEVGQNYLVYAKWEWGFAVTSRCMGTKLLDKANPSALGPSQALKDKLYIRLRNACMGRNDTSCCLSSLKAMREGYNIPEPEEGCPSGTIPDRLRCAGSYTWCIPVGEKDHRPLAHIPK